MARSLEYIQKEIVRVSEACGLDMPTMARSAFLLESDVTKHDLDTYGGWVKVRTDTFYTLSTKKSSKNLSEARGVEIRNSVNRANERARATNDYFADKLGKLISDSLQKNPIAIPKSSFIKMKSASDNTIANVLLSDLHFGVDVLPTEVLGAEYNWTIASRRLAHLALTFIQDVACRSVSKIRIFLNGDILHGVIHIDDACLKPMTEQFTGALQLLTDFIYSIHKNTMLPIEVICTPGNHDRMTYKTPQRTISQRWDSFSSLLYLAIEAAFKHCDDIDFIIPMSGLGIVPVPSGGVLLSTHGDTCPEVGNVSKSINTEKLAHSVYTMCATNAVKQRIDAVVYGHWHTPTVQMLPTGQMILVNGSLIGSDTYSQNAVGCFNSKPAQIIFYSDKTSAITNINIVQFHEDINQDATLNNLVRIPVIHERGNLNGA